MGGIVLTSGSARSRRRTPITLPARADALADPAAEEALAGVLLADNGMVAYVTLAANVAKDLVMAPSAVDERGHMTNGVKSHHTNGSNGDKSETMFRHDYVHFDPKLKPKDYQIKGTNPDSKILFRDVNIFDSTGREPFRGDVYIEGERIMHVGEVPSVDALEKDSN
ncbi:hypothetical protein LTR53_015076, partial [Teratosphaeriaceae sp. CCFEE 6253]